MSLRRANILLSSIRPILAPMNTKDLASSLAETASGSRVMWFVFLKSHFRPNNCIIATWCMPCKSVLPLIEQISEKYPITFIKIDADTHRDAMRTYSIQGVPTFIFQVDGKTQETIVGADPNKIQTTVKKYAPID